MTEAKRKAICEQVSQQWLGKTGRFDSSSIALYQVQTVMLTEQLQEVNETLWRQCSLGNQYPGIILMLAPLPADATKMFLVHTPPVFPLELAGLPIYYSAPNRQRTLAATR